MTHKRRSMSAGIELMSENEISNSGGRGVRFKVPTP
jgi:hypothetical protein